MHASRTLFPKLWYFTLALASCALKLKEDDKALIFSLWQKSKPSKTSLSNLKGKNPYMTSSCHISALDDDKNRPRMWAYQNKSPWSRR